jgi:hypothetical protein
MTYNLIWNIGSTRAQIDNVQRNQAFESHFLPWVTRLPYIKNHILKTTRCQPHDESSEPGYCRAFFQTGSTMKGISFAFIGLTSLLAQGAVVFTKQGAVDAPRTAAAESNELFPLPAGFKIEPDLDASKKPSTPGAKVIKIRQGPFKLTPKVELLQDEQFLTDPLLPCTDCWITAIQGGLEFANGTAATVEQGAMLQHLYILSGSGRDEVCRTYNLPQPNRLYVTGNERETVRLNPDGLKYGQYLAATDEWFALRWNAVNTGTAPLDVFLTQVRLLQGHSSNFH